MNFYVQFVLVFCAALLGDICWTKYFIAVAKKHPIVSANWSAAIIFVGAFAVISYNNNHWLAIAAGLGSWVGTYITVRRERNKTTPPKVPEFLSETQELV